MILIVLLSTDIVNVTHWPGLIILISWRSSKVRNTMMSMIYFIRILIYQKKGLVEMERLSGQEPEWEITWEVTYLWRRTSRTLRPTWLTSPSLGSNTQASKHLSSFQLQMEKLVPGTSSPWVNWSVINELRSLNCWHLPPRSLVMSVYPGEARPSCISMEWKVPGPEPTELVSTTFYWSSGSRYCWLGLGGPPHHTTHQPL